MVYSERVAYSERVVFTSHVQCFLRAEMNCAELGRGCLLSTLCSVARE